MLNELAQLTDRRKEVNEPGNEDMAEETHQSNRMLCARETMIQRSWKWSCGYYSRLMPAIRLNVASVDCSENRRIQGRQSVSEKSEIHVLGSFPEILPDLGGATGERICVALS